MYSKGFCISAPARESNSYLSNEICRPTIHAALIDPNTVICGRAWACCSRLEAERRNMRNIQHGLRRDDATNSFLPQVPPIFFHFVTCVPIDPSFFATSVAAVTLSSCPTHRPSHLSRLRRSQPFDAMCPAPQALLPSSCIRKRRWQTRCLQTSTTRLWQGKGDAAPGMLYLQNYSFHLKHVDMARLRRVSCLRSPASTCAASSRSITPPHHLHLAH